MNNVQDIYLYTYPTEIHLLLIYGRKRELKIKQGHLFALMPIWPYFTQNALLTYKQTSMFANIFLCRLLQSNDIKSLVNSKTVFQSSVRTLAIKELNVWQMLKTNDMLPSTIKF